jgi:ATP-dependent Clp protease ATP-binding subunit ClpX
VEQRSKAKVLPISAAADLDGLRGEQATA